MRLPTMLMLLLACGAAKAAAAAALSGRVVAVNDGHTLVALVDNRRIPVRIAGIAAPVQREKRAIVARQSLIAVCGGEPVRIETLGTQADGALIARVECNGKDAAVEQVKRGMAAVVAAPAGRDAELRALQAEAQAARRGVWAYPPVSSPQAR